MWTYLLSRFNLKTLAGAQAVVIVVALSYAWTTYEELKTKRTELDTAKAAILHPQVIERVRTVTIQGPVRVITKIVERPGGEKETTIEETREPVSETLDTNLETKAANIETIVPKARSDRWLLGLDLRSWSPTDLTAYTVYGGCSFRNRFDVLLGAGQHDHFEGHLMVIARF